MNSFFTVLRSEGHERLLALAVIAILLVLFTPIPPLLLDFLLLTNFALALLILLVTFDTAKPLSFSTFPALLLMTTLFRLALNISATRLILDQGDAGQVIAAVGGHMVSGNYIIGFVVFLILVVVQYVVVTSGAQRVAEVAARFTLDSLPGKQMSIDADLNMGIIDQDEARQRRGLLERESNFYGAMDGASKFVKGDAVAGIVIILINIIGGLSVGLLQHDMSWADALHHYTLLTVGDGIVTQIPSLIIAVAAGILITRAATDARLGQELGRQLSADPKTVMVVALVALLMMFMPGLPMLPALLLFMLLALAFYWSRRRQQAQAEQATDVAAGVSEAMPAVSEPELYALITTEPFELCLSADLTALVQSDDGPLTAQIDGMRRQFAGSMGFVLPVLHLRIEQALEAASYQVCLHGAVVGRGELYFSRVLAINPGSVTSALEGLATREPSYGLPAIWIVPDLKAQARAAGYTLVAPEMVLLTHLAGLARRHAADLLSRAETERLLECKRESMGSLVAELVPQVLSYSDIQRVLQLLLREQVPISNLDSILEVLVDAGRSNKQAEDLAERVRERLGAGIYKHLLDRQGDLQVITLDPALEACMLSALRQRDSALLPTVELELFIKAAVGAAEQLLSQNKSPVLLCAPPLRRVLHQFMARALPHMTVLSVNEIGSNARVQAAAMIELPGFPMREAT